MNRIIRFYIVLLVLAITIVSFFYIKKSLAEDGKLGNLSPGSASPASSAAASKPAAYTASDTNLTASYPTDSSSPAVSSSSAASFSPADSFSPSAPYPADSTSPAASFPPADSSLPASPTPEAASPVDSITSIPKHNPSDYLIAVDAGHGGIDKGTQSDILGPMIYEKNITIAIAKILMELLVSNGYRVLMIRESDENIDRIDRIEFANEKNASLYISIHCDLFTDASVSGTTTYYSPDNTSILGSLTHTDFASCVHTKLMENVSFFNRGLRQVSDLAVLRRAQMPSVLIEPGFMSNYSDILKLIDPAVMESIAQGIFEGITDSLDKSIGD